VDIVKCEIKQLKLKRRAKKRGKSAEGTAEEFLGVRCGGCGRQRRVFKAKKIAEQPSAISSLRILRALRAVLSTHILAFCLKNPFHTPRILYAISIFILSVCHLSTLRKQIVRDDIAEQPSAISSLRILRALRAVLSTHILAYSSVFRILRIEHPKILPRLENRCLLSA
jgi:hypothetical protein